MSIIKPFFNKTSNKTKGIFLLLLIMTIISCPNAESPSSSSGGSDDSGPLVAVSVELIAGGSTEGTADGKGESAKFYEPKGIAVDTDGYIYLADTANNSIRKITPDGTVSTYAGESNSDAAGRGYSNGTGASAKFNYPTDVLIIDANTLYVLDDNGIRKIIKGTTTGTVSTPVTRTDAKFGSSYASSLTSMIRKPNTADTFYIINPVDASVSRFINGVIESTDGTTFNIIIDIIKNTTTPDTGNLHTSQNFQDAAFDTSGNMYVSTGDGHSIFTFNPTTAERHPTNHANFPNAIKKLTFFVGSPTSIAGDTNGVGTAAKLNGPAGMLVKGDYIYVADSRNHVIRMVQISTKTVTTMVGLMGTAGQQDGSKDVATFNRPRDLEFAPNGDIIISEDHAIRRIVVQK